MQKITRRTAEYSDVDAEQFRSEIVPLNRPAVLRGLVEDWPAVDRAAQSPEAACAYVKGFGNGADIPVVVGPPHIKGRFFYREDMRGVNFERRPMKLGDALDRLLSLQKEETPPSLYVEAMSLRDYAPGFSAANDIALPPISVSPRIWIGGATTVQTHYDLFDNIACLVAGRRRFTLFPPEQIANLYVGPLDFTPSGPPISMVSLYEPNFERYPRFADALEEAEIAELEPGDAIYIPFCWWHHVQALERFNILVNYWWNESPPAYGSPFDALLHAVMVFRELPENQRAAWRNMFGHYVFKDNDEPLAHLNREHRGMMGDITPDRAREMRAILARALSRS